MTTMMLTEESGGEGGSREEDDEEEEDDSSQNSGSSKRQRRDSRSTGSCGSAELLWAAVYVDPNLTLSPSTNTNSSLTVDGHDAHAQLAAGSRPASGRGASSGSGAGGASPAAISDDADDDAAACLGRAMTPAAVISKMITTSIAESVSREAEKKETFEYNDWEEIKETLTRASDLCDRDDPTAALPLLRALIHECHRFLVRFPDPSLFFSRPVSQRRRDGSDSPDSVEERPWHESRWPRRPSGSRMSTSPSSSSDEDFGWSGHQNRSRPRHRGESPTALHAVLGVALFLFGNIIARDPSLAIRPREPTSPSPYWLAALDVLNAGDNLPCQTSGKDNTSSDSTSSIDGWPVAIAWGRTLVALAYEATKKQQSTLPSPATARPSPPSPSTSTARLSPPPSIPTPRLQTTRARYHPRSPLAAIASLHTASGLAHSRATAPELLTMAADQFSRGIFRMPHNTPATPTPTRRTPPRPHVLFTLASEVLAVSERLEDSAARARWAAWADTILSQMDMEAKADVDAWRARLGAARGRCWLVIGGVRGEVSVSGSKGTEEACAGLNTAISFFDRAKGSDKSLVDVQPWLTEALLTLAGLTADECAREALYARAQVEGGDVVMQKLGPRLTRSRTMSMVVRMDES